MGGWEESGNCASVCVCERVCVCVYRGVRRALGRRRTQSIAPESSSQSEAPHYMYTLRSTNSGIQARANFPRVENGRTGTVEQRWRGEQRTHERLCPTRCSETEERSRSQGSQVYRSLLQAAYFLQPLHGLYLVSCSKTSSLPTELYGKLL